MPPTGKAFITAIMATLGVDSQTALVKLLKHEISQPRINKWFNGKGSPDFAAAMYLIERAGWLTDEANGRLAAAARAEAQAAKNQATLGVGDVLQGKREETQPEQDSPSKPRQKKTAPHRKHVA